MLSIMPRMPDVVAAWLGASAANGPGGAPAAARPHGSVARRPARPVHRSVPSRCQRRRGGAVGEGLLPGAIVEAEPAKSLVQLSYLTRQVASSKQQVASGK